MRRIAAALAALVLSVVSPGVIGTVYSQGGPVQQSGAMTPGHPSMWITNGVIGDGGPSLSGKLKELGITNTGTPFCINDAPITGPYHQLCLGAAALGGGLLSYNPFGGAPALPLDFSVNGITYTFPFVTTNTPTGNFGPFVSQFAGYDATGATDSSSALNLCLASAGSGGTCFVDPHAKLLLNSSVHIPANTTLSCGFTFNNQQETPATYATLPALRLNQGFTISASGEGATLKNCLIYRAGMALPSPDASAFAGIALSDAGFADFAVTDSVIGGFDTCIWITGKRPMLMRDYTDCAGVNKAAIELDVGNTDSGYAQKLKLDINFTQGPTCTSAIRPGTGLRVAGTPIGAAGVFLDDIVVLGYQVNYDFQNAVIAGKLWSDGIGVACGYGSTIGLRTTSNLNANQITIDQANTGIQLLGNGALSMIDQLFIGFIGTDAVVLGNATASGNLNVGTLVAATVSRWGILVAGANSDLHANRAYLENVNGNNPPFISASAGTVVLGNNNNSFSIQSLFTGGMDQTAASPYGGFAAGTGSEPMLAGLRLPAGGIACTGLGSGTCGPYSADAGANHLAGAILLSPAGTPSNAGNVVLTFSVPAQNAWLCTGMLTNASTAWPTGAELTAVPAGNQKAEFQWSGAIAAGQTYGIVYQCHPL